MYQKTKLGAIKLIFSVLITTSLIWLMLGLPCWAQGTTKLLSEPSSSQELQVFLDDFFIKQMSDEHIPGAVFILVKDGRILFSKGYGYADIEKRIPVVPDKTLFRIGSISKLFTATAVMQLAEQGKLKLDNNVNNYLQKFQIPNTYKKPVTFSNLLTHTDGFDVGWGVGAFARTKSKMTPLDQFLAKRLPKRILPPSEIYLYSDVGMTLAGYLVEEISGIPFTQYIKQNILQPLEMFHSSFQQPLPPQLINDLAVGYKYQNGSYQKQAFAYVNSFPAGAFMATAKDMAHFMIAHLQNGCYGNKCIMTEATTQQMHASHFKPHPLLPGSAYGFQEYFQNNSPFGQKGIEHSGRSNGYNSELLLLPEQNVGFFIAHNTNAPLIGKLVNQLLNRYYPTQQLQQESIEEKSYIQESIQKFSGTYRSIRYPHKTLEKLGAIFLGDAPEYSIKNNTDSTLTIYPQANKWTEVKPSLFRQINKNTYTAFRKNNQGNVTYRFSGNSVSATSEKLMWYQTTTFQLFLLGGCSLIFLSTCIVWTKDLLNRSKRRFSHTSRITKKAKLLAVITSALNLVFVFGTILTLSLTDFWEFFFGLPKTMFFLLFVPLVTTVTTLGLIIFSILIWKNQLESITLKLYYSLVTLAALGFIEFLHYGNFLGFQI